jgi:hypothetical protein
MMHSLKNALSFLLFAGVLLVLVGLARSANTAPIFEESSQYNAPVYEVLKVADTTLPRPKLTLVDVAG